MKVWLISELIYFSLRQVPGKTEVQGASNHAYTFMAVFSSSFFLVALSYLAILGLENLYRSGQGMLIQQ